jgi:hypothetical protein
MDLNYEELVKELSELQKELNLFGNPNKTISEMFNGYENKSDLIKAFKYLMKVDKDKVKGLFEDFLMLTSRSGKTEENKVRVKEIRKLLEI